MSDDQDDGEYGTSGGLDDLTPDVSEERPLDSLLPEMQKSGLSADQAPHADAPTDVDAIHPRVLEVELEPGHEWTMALWDDPGDEGVQTELVQLLRATILRELSRPPRQQRNAAREFLGARILSFESLREPTRSALGSLGWEEQAFDSEEYSERMKAWRDEAQAADLASPGRPTSIWQLPVAHPDPPRHDRLDEIAETMLESLGDEIWGATPGGMSKLLAKGLEDRFGAEIGLGAGGIDTMVSHVVPEAPDELCWVRPVVFQALCDFVGVVLHGSYGVRVQWGLSEPDQRGLVPPPMFRDPNTQRTIPIGRALVDWCVLPEPESTPSGRIAERVEELAESLASDR